MSYQTAISGLDWQMVPSGMIVPSGGIAAMQQYEQGMGAICAGNNVGYINANLTSGDYTGTIADIVYDTIMVTGNIATNRNINLYYNAGTLNGVKRYFVILTPQASSGGPFTVTITTGTGKTVNVPIAPSGDTLTSPDLQIEITVDPSGNVRSASFIVSGFNSNGSWVKFADHTMMANTVSGTAGPTNTVLGSVFFTGTAMHTAWPAAFASLDRVVHTAKGLTGGSGMSQEEASTATEAHAYYMSSASGSTGSISSIGWGHW